MRVQRENKIVTCIAILGLFVVYMLLCFDDDLSKVGDQMFLYNRAVQIKDCLANGVWPFLYYEDVGGIGYGTPIFYGHLTLFPFIFFLDDIAVFVKLYYLACLLLNFFGFRCFIKRISENATLTACFYIFSMAFLGIYHGNLPANAMAVGWSWFFFAACIDYFRDGHGFAFFILTYFMIWQSNFNATVIATLVCFGIFCVYFQREQILGYVRLAVATALTMGFNIVNMFVHRDAIALQDAESMLSVLNPESDARVMSLWPLGGYIARSSNDILDGCIGFMTVALFVLFIYSIVRGIGKESLRFKICSLIIGVAVVVGHILGTYGIWSVVYKATQMFFQFPIRYYVILFGFALAVFSRVVKSNWVVYVVCIWCVLDIFIVNPFRSEETEFYYYVSAQMANGEYASSDFIMDYEIYSDYRDNVHSKNGFEYPHTHEYNLIIVDCSANVGEDTLTLPKLYYYGYQATGPNGERFTVSSGYSNYCEVDIGNYHGELCLQYRLPLVLKCFFVIQVVFVFGLIVWYALCIVRDRRGRLEITE